MSLVPVKSCSPAPLFVKHKRGLYGRESMVFWKRSSARPRRTPATLSPQSSLAMWGKLFILRFSQVATNYTLFIFAGALCKTPRARCSEMQDAYIYNCSRWVWLAAPVRRSCVPIWLPSALPSLPGRALIITAFCLPCSSLLFVPLLLTFSEAFFPVQPCNAQLL